jgi:hypothetical protein
LRDGLVNAASGGGHLSDENFACKSGYHVGSVQKYGPQVIFIDAALIGKWMHKLDVCIVVESILS